MSAPWPTVGGDCLGFERAPDCPATDDPAGLGMTVYCTRDAGHPMPHVADGLEGIVHVWVSDADLRDAAEANPARAVELAAWLFAPDPAPPLPGRRRAE